jgi:hypothetical protein
MEWTQVLSTKSEMADAILGDYGVKDMPSLWLIDPHGTVVARDFSPETAAATLKATLGF